MLCSISAGNISFIFAGKVKVLHDLVTRDLADIQKKVIPRTVAAATPIIMLSCNGRCPLSLNIFVNAFST